MEDNTRYTYDKTLESGTKVCLTMIDMCDIKMFYDAACTAEYLIDTGRVLDKDEALNLGYEVRRQMDKYGYDEEFAIKEVFAIKEGIREE